MTFMTGWNMTVQVRVELHEQQPRIDIEKADHVVVRNFQTSGQIVIAGLTDYLPTAHRASPHCDFFHNPDAGRTRPISSSVGSCVSRLTNQALGTGVYWRNTAVPSIGHGPEMHIVAVFPIKAVFT